MTPFAEELLAALRKVDAAMVATGAPAIHPRWWSALEAFYSSGKRQLVIRKSRRIGASSIVASRLIVASFLVLRRRLHVPAGETATLACVSVKRSEASARLKNVAACLSALGIPHEPKADGIELDGTFEVRVLTASARSEVGQLLAFLWCDEVSRWLDSDTGANPASEVLAALKPSLATIADARIFLCSTPLTFDDYHAKAYAEGETEGQSTAFLAPSWACNPQLTEADCRRLESNEARFQREYCGIPSDGAVESFFEGIIDQCVDRGRDGDELLTATGVRHVAAIDPGFRNDGFGFAIAHREARDEQVFTIVDQARVWRPHNGLAVPVELTVRSTARLARSFGCSVIYCDQHSIDALQPLYLTHGVRLADARWTQSNKVDRFELVRAEMEAGRLRLPNAPDLLKELRGIGSRLLPSGATQIQARGSGHDDLTCAVVMAAALSLRFEPDYGSGRLGSRGASFKGEARSSGAMVERDAPRIVNPHAFTGPERRRQFINDEF